MKKHHTIAQAQEEPVFTLDAPKEKRSIPRSLLIEMKRIYLMFQSLPGYAPTAETLDAVERTFLQVVSTNLRFYDTGSMNSEINVQADSYEKDVRPILDWLRERGWKPRGRPYDCESNSSRRYSFTLRNETSMKNRVDLIAVFKATGTCTYVKTGTREVDVMELKCHGTMLPAQTPEEAGQGLAEEGGLL